MSERDTSAHIPVGSIASLCMVVLLRWRALAGSTSLRTLTCTSSHTYDRGRSIRHRRTAVARRTTSGSENRSRRLVGRAMAPAHSRLKDQGSRLAGCGLRRVAHGWQVVACGVWLAVQYSRYVRGARRHQERLVVVVVVLSMVVVVMVMVVVAALLPHGRPRSSPRGQVGGCV